MHSSSRDSRSKLRGIVAAALALVTLAALAGLAGAAYAASNGASASAAEYQYGGTGTPAAKKVTLCHKGKTIQVGIHALKAHTGHADTLGTCASAARAEAAEAKKSEACVKSEEGHRPGKKGGGKK
jgi:hypothetical protein